MIRVLRGRRRQRCCAVFAGRARRSLTFVVCLALATPAVTAGAQSPWVVTVAPTMDPLPAGFCAAVRLTITDARGDVPRNAAGYRVTISDFDMVVSGAGVVGVFAGASNYSVCACQSATIGTVGTITATYPAGRLAERSRVSGVTAKAESTFTTAKSKGDVNPPACVAAPPIAVATTARPAAPPLELAPAPGTATAPTPAASATSSFKTASAGVSPTGFRLMPSVPLVASLAWDEMPGALTYAVSRSDGISPSVVRVVRTQAELKTLQDVVPDPRPTYRYTLVVAYTNGTSATAPIVEFTSPPLKNPTGFTAVDRGLGNVDFQWQALEGAVRYRLDGPGLPGTGFYTTTTSTRYPKIPAGANSWKLTALYQGNFADYANPSTASTVVRVLPPHTQPWLSKGNGVGSLATVQAPLNITDSPDFSNQRSGYLDTLFDARRVRWLGFEDRWEDGKIGLVQWVNLDLPLWNDSKEMQYEAVYGNAIDLGVGRRARCAQGTGSKPPYRLTTTCYATAHGVVPGLAGFNDFATITHPQPGMGADFILAMLITKDVSGSTFMVFLKPTGKDPEYSRLAAQVSLDTEGPKYLPHACLSCHGGKYNPVTRKVDGSSFLPLDPGLLAFTSPSDQEAQEESIREINSMIVTSDPLSPVATYLRGLYGGAIAIPGRKAIPDYVPAGWTPQAGFYRSVVKPYCAMCHLAAPPSWNFATWANFKENAALIKVAVCNAHTMPHSELQYKAFWTKDTGPIYTPGLLAAALEVPSCP